MSQTIAVPGVGNLQFPDGMSQQDMAAAIQKNFPDIHKTAAQKGAEATLAEMGTGERLLVGVGKGMHDLYEGAKQIAGGKTTLEETKEADQALMGSKAGKIGDIAGTVAAAVPTAFIPGANTAAGAALIGGGLGALQPVRDGESRTKNVALGAAGGQLGKYVGEGVAASISALAVRSAARQAARQAVRAGDDAAIQAAQQAGYRVPASMANPSALNKIVEGVGGKIKLQQRFSAINQENTDKLAKQALGLPKDEPITAQSLEKLRQDGGQAYEDIRAWPLPFQANQAYKDSISKLGGEWAAAAKSFPSLIKNEKIDGLIKGLSVDSMSPNEAIALSKKLRFDGNANYANRIDPEKLALGKAQKKAADAIDQMVEDNLAKHGQKALSDDWRASRKLIAQSYDVQAALNPVTGHVSATKLAGIMSRRPLTAELKEAASFGKAFPKMAQSPEKVGIQQEVSPLDAGAAMLIGGGRALAGDPGAMAEAAASMLLRPGLRAAATSKPYLNMFGQVPKGAPTASVQQIRAAARDEKNKAMLRLIFPELFVNAQKQQAP